MPSPLHANNWSWFLYHLFEKSLAWIVTSHFQDDIYRKLPICIKQTGPASGLRWAFWFRLRWKITRKIMPGGQQKVASLILRREYYDCRLHERYIWCYGILSHCHCSQYAARAHVARWLLGDWLPGILARRAILAFVRHYIFWRSALFGRGWRVTSIFHVIFDGDGDVLPAKCSASCHSRVNARHDGACLMI